MSACRRVLLAAALAFALAPAEPALAAPAASFVWFPTMPHTGEQVSLVSTSTDVTSPIVATAWDLAGEGGAFTEGGAVGSTTFTTPGSHVVELRVTAADGSSSMASEAIQVTTPPLEQMLPFPVVRIVGSLTRSRTKIQLLSADAPPGTQVTLRCRGRRCPASYQFASIPVAAIDTVTVDFPLFERALPDGTVLELRVFREGAIGKYTRFVMRARKPPLRVDACLDAAQPAPVSCPR
jgi:hypothetical protein